MKTRPIILLLLLLNCQIHAQESKPQAKDTLKPLVLGQSLGIQSQELNEKRNLNIYLPEGYNQADTIKYPVIYLLDGGMDEDFIHVVGLIQFNNFSWINRVPKSIVVGIENVDRKRDLTFVSSVESEKKRYPEAGQSGNFINFIEKELQPFIDKKYNTSDSKMLIGQSIGGLFAVEVLLKKPLLFNKYIIVSPSIWWDNGSILNRSSELLLEKFNRPTEVCISVGKEGLTPSEIPRVMEVDANLLVEKLKSSKSKNLNVYFDYLPLEDHATISHQAIFNALRLLYPVNTK